MLILKLRYGLKKADGTELDFYTNVTERFYFTVNIPLQSLLLHWNTPYVDLKSPYTWPVNGKTVPILVFSKKQINSLK